MTTLTNNVSTTVKEIGIVPTLCLPSTDELDFQFPEDRVGGAPADCKCCQELWEAIRRIFEILAQIQTALKILERNQQAIRRVIEQIINEIHEIETNITNVNVELGTVAPGVVQELVTDVFLDTEDDVIILKKKTKPVTVTAVAAETTTTIDPGVICEGV